MRKDTLTKYTHTMTLDEAAVIYYIANFMLVENF